jgi:hypothetical protein
MAVGAQESSHTRQEVSSALVQETGPADRLEEAVHVPRPDEDIDRDHRCLVVRFPLFQKPQLCPREREDLGGPLGSWHASHRARIRRGGLQGIEKLERAFLLGLERRDGALRPQ